MRTPAGMVSSLLLSFPAICLFSRLNTGCDGVSASEDHLSASVGNRLPLRHQLSSFLPENTIPPLRSESLTGLFLSAIIL